MADSTQKLKSRIADIVRERRLCSCMNDTKWAELRDAMMNEMPFPPPFTVKFLTDDSPCAEEQGWHEAYVFEGLFNGAFAVEWLRIRPCARKERGRLIEPEIIDAGRELREILEKYSIPYEENDGVYCIYGYR